MCDRTIDEAYERRKNKINERQKENRKIAEFVKSSVVLMKFYKENTRPEDIFNFQKNCGEFL